MQKCLNEDASYLHKRFTKHPWIPVLLVLFILSGIAILVSSLLCNIKYPCTYQQQDVALYFGMNICLISTIFIALPCIIRFILNGIWYNQEPVLPVITRSPITSRDPPRSRSNSREKIPPSPKGPVPKHGMKSFKEYHSEAWIITWNSPLFRNFCFRRSALSGSTL